MIFDKSRITINSSKGQLYKVERFIEEICDRFNLSNSYFGNISLALMEAVDNAIKHGNGGDEQKLIEIDFESKPGELVFKVKDQGAGFDDKVIEDPTEAVDEQDAERGRGIYMIKALTDDLNFYEHGSSVELIFRIKGIGIDLDRERKEMLRGYTDNVEKTTKEKKKQ